MSGIEKMCLLSLALDRIAKHGHLFLNEEISTKEMINAIKAIKHIIDNNTNWDQFIAKESRWWVDLKEQLAKKVYRDSDILKCEKCDDDVKRKIRVDSNNYYLCERCFKDWAKVYNSILKESYKRNFIKWIS